MIIRGVGIILCAAFVWGVGNAVTGLTAHKYLSSGSLFPAVDIALANTLGGLLFLALVLLGRSVLASISSPSPHKQNLTRLGLCRSSKQSMLSGALKGANTCLFVFSTTYIVATQSLIFESTYIIWSLLLGIFFLTRKAPLIPTILKAVLLFLGVILVSGYTSLVPSNGQELRGLLFGIAAGVSYALFLFSWSAVTESLVDLQSQLISTTALLIMSSLTIVFLTELLSATLLHAWWMPFTNLKVSDILLQLINGAFVVGLVYLLVTIGMANLKNAREGSSYLAALGLSFSIPFTLLPEFIFGKFSPTSLQVVGILLFMGGFVLMSASVSETQSNS